MQTKPPVFETFSTQENIERDYRLPSLISMAKESEHPVFAISKKSIQRQYQKLQTYLPMVQTHYAIKALPMQEVVNCLHETGSCFDVASNGEIDLLRNANVNPQKIIHTHPIKRIADIEYALQYGITTFVVDNEEELNKFVNYKQKVRLLLRLSFKNPETKCDLSSKFGLKPELSIPFILHAKNKGIHIDGLSFHVGSNCISPSKMLEALSTCNTLYDKLEKLGVPMNRIDIGGGFPVNIDMTIQDEINFFEPVADYLKKYFSAYQIISEPGRFIAAPSAIVLCKVIGKSLRDGIPCYYLNDGVYNNFSGQIFDFASYSIRSAHHLNSGDSLFSKSILFGPTCDSLDIITDSILLPDLNVNDILLATQIGAYSRASSSNFNFLGQTIIHFEN